MNWFNHTCKFFFSILSILVFSCNSIPSVITLEGNKYTDLTDDAVYLFLNTECPICKNYQGSFKKLSKISIPVYFVFPGDQDSLDIAQFIAYDSISTKYVLIDRDYSICKQYKVEATPQAIVKWKSKIAYSGKIDDRFMELGASKKHASINYVENALNSLQKNASVEIPYTKPVGCFIEHSNSR